MMIVGNDLHAAPQRRPVHALCALALSLSLIACGDDGAANDGVAQPGLEDGGLITFEAGAVQPAPDASGSASGDSGAVTVDHDADTLLDSGASGALGDAGGDAGTSDASSSGRLCHLEGDQVGIIGDSYVQFTDFTEFLQDHARKAGALKADDTYVDHALGGASMNGLLSIPSQWPDAVADAKSRGSQGIKLLIMDGGGNDILVDHRECLEFASASEIDADCKKVVQDALDTAKTLSMQVKQDGAEQIIFFFYPHLPQDSLGGGSYPNTILDYAVPLVKKACETELAVPCHFVDLRPSFDDGMGYPKDGLIQIDGIHPQAAGATIMADVIWKVMQDNCLASK